MDVITVDEKNKQRIQKHIKQEIVFYEGYEQDIELLEQSGQLTEELARKVFSEIMNDAHRIRTILEPEENDEFQDLIDEVYYKYDAIHKPESLEEFGFYNGKYMYMEFAEVYANMQTAFEVKELDTQYYICRDLRNIAETVINSIDGIEKYQIELQPEAKERLQKIKEELRDLLSAEKTDINGIQERIDIYNGYATDIWNDYLTDINDVDNSQYRWVVHNLTKGELEGDFRNKYMSTSLITNNAMGRYGNADYGLIINPKHIVCASYRDTYTLNTRDDEENLFNIRPPLMLPQEVEDICIQQTIEENGEMLNYETTPIYSELVVDEYEIEGVYYISYGEQELAKDYERAKKVADERGLPLIERDISKYRAEHGLEPMTDKAKMNLCRNILWKCCEGDRELEQTYNQFAKGFIKYNFNDFYKKFMQLKENPEYSKEDILKAFADIVRGNIDFGKIAQNIDEMYMRDEKRQILHIETECGLSNMNEKTKQSYAYDSEKQQEPIDETNFEIPEEIIGQPSAEKVEKDNGTCRINEFGEIIRTEQEQQDIRMDNDIPIFIPPNETQQVGQYNQQYENNADDQIKQIQEVDSSAVELWTNRFNNWYTAIDRVSQNARNKFVKVKSDIVKVISDKIKERTSRKEYDRQDEQRK